MNHPIISVLLLVAWLPLAAQRQIPDYEADVYGPLPFPEEVTGFLHHELHYLLDRQNNDGSWDSAQPMGKGKTTPEAGGTVGNISLTSMCGYSLRNFTELGPDRFEEAITRALRFVTTMVNDGKLRSNTGDTSWQYIYALRFLVSEYPRIKDPARKKQIQDACRILVTGLQETQGGSYAEQSLPFSWTKRSNPGMLVDQQGVVTACSKDTPAFKAGIRIGDRLLTAGKTPVDTAIRYALAELKWTGEKTIPFVISQNGSPKEVTVNLPSQHPGALGLTLRKSDLTIEGFKFLSNQHSAPLAIGDQLKKINGQPVFTITDLDQFTFVPGQSIELELLRQGMSHKIDYVCAPVPAADFGITFPNHLFDQSSEKGQRIAGFHRGSCLLKAGLKKGDRLLRLDGSLIVNRRHFRELTRSLWGGKKVRVTYLSGGQEKVVTVTAGTLSDKEWLRGFHGLEFEGRGIRSVQYNSPGDLAGCRSGDVILEINGKTPSNDGEVAKILNSFPAGKEVALTILRNGDESKVSLTIHRHPETRWIAKHSDAGGGWGYLGGERGGNSFTTADALRELLKARRVIPEIHVPDELIRRAFAMLSTLRMKQPNSEIESYRYDTGGSFWRHEDIRADIGRLNSVELACLMYSDSDLDTGEHKRTQNHLEKTLREWLKHRGILDLVKFPEGHGKLSIAPYFWMYSYRTTLEAADYFKINDELKTEVQEVALKAFFKHMEFRNEEMLGTQGWIIGNDRSKELHDSCQLLDGLATIKHLIEPRLKITRPELKKVIEPFYATQYGEALRLLTSPLKSTEAKKLNLAIISRYQKRIAEIKAIHKERPFDGLRYLLEMKPHFEGSSAQVTIENLEIEWRQNLPDRPPWIELGSFPGNSTETDPSKAWDRIMKLQQANPQPKNWKDLFKKIDPKKNAVSGTWRQADGQLISPSKPNARLELPAAPKGNYRLETQFTRIQGTCTTFMLPIGNTGATLVLGGWNGKVSGLAYLNGKDANRNATTRDGNYSANQKHTLLVEVRLLPEKKAQLTITLDGKPYLKWEGLLTSLKPDRAWKLHKSGSIGIGSYASTIVFHSCRFEELD